MRQRFVRMALGVFVLLLPSCQAARVGKQGQDLRHALLGMYTHQIMDNLIRAHDYLPFVQLEYTEIFVQELDEWLVEASGGETVTDARTAVFSGASTNTLARTIASVFNLKGNLNRKGTLSFKAKPITTRNEIYKAYIRFAQDSELFICQPERPCDCQHHLVQATRDGRHCFVRHTARKEFLELAMFTSFMHGGETARGYYEVKITKIGDPKPTGRGDSIETVLTLDRFVPNGNGFLSIVDPRSGRRRIRIPVFQQEALASGVLTQTVEVTWSPKKRGVTALELEGASARFYSEEYPPESSDVPSILESLEDVANTLDRINVGQN